MNNHSGNRQTNPLAALLTFVIVLVWIVVGSTAGAGFLTLASASHNPYLLGLVCVGILVYLGSLLYGGGR